MEGRGIGIGIGEGRLVLEEVEAMVRAVVASLGSEERMMDAERFSGILDGASEGIVSVIAVTFGSTRGA